MLINQHLQFLGDKTIMIPSKSHVDLPYAPHGERWFFKEKHTQYPDFTSTQRNTDVKIMEKPDYNNIYHNGFLNSEILMYPRWRDSKVNNWYRPPPTYEGYLCAANCGG